MSPLTNAILTGAQINAWPIQNSSVDCVMSIEVPVVECDWFWQECNRVLKTNGIVIITTLNRSSYKGILYRIRPLMKPFLSAGGKQWAERSFYNLSARAIVRQLEKNNFYLEQVLGFNWLPVGRESDLSIIPQMATIEQKLGFRNLVFQSPWVLIKARIR